VTPFEKVVTALSSHGCRPKVRGQHASAHCPAHDDSRPSLEVDVGDDERALLHCFAECDTELIVSLIDLEMSDLFVETSSRRDGSFERPKKRGPAGVQDTKYSITPRFLIESCDPMCQSLFNYLDLRQGTRGRFARGDQAIAEALGCQARTVRVHAEHLAGAGVVRIHKHVTETGAHKATEYEVIHNPARKKVNENATTPLRGRRARPRSRLAAMRKTLAQNRQGVARQTRDTSTSSRDSTLPEKVVRLSRDSRHDVGRKTRDALGTQEGNQEKNGSFFDDLDPDGDIADASKEMLDRAPLTATPPTDDATLERLFAEDMRDDPDWLFASEDEAVAALMRAFPGSELVTA
jgi:hypothetical protein